MNTVLLLNADYRPWNVIRVQKAVSLIFDEKGTSVEDYSGRQLRSPSMAMPFPAVVVLNRYVRTRAGVRFTRANLLARDNYTCQYCGKRPKTADGKPLLADLTVDHVVPRAASKRGRVTLPWSGENVPVTCWENVACACVDCNGRKAARTPTEARMTLLNTPRKPTPWDALRMSLGRTNIPDEWQAFVPENWRGYWDDELT